MERSRVKKIFGLSSFDILSIQPFVIRPYDPDPNQGIRPPIVRSEDLKVKS